MCARCRHSNRNIVPKCPLCLGDALDIPIIVIPGPIWRKIPLKRLVRSPKFKFCSTLRQQRSLAGSIYSFIPIFANHFTSKSISKMELFCSQKEFQRLGQWTGKYLRPITVQKWCHVSTNHSTEVVSCVNQSQYRSSVTCQPITVQKWCHVSNNRVPSHKMLTDKLYRKYW